MLPPDQLNHRKYHPLPDPPDPATEELVEWKKLDPPRQKALAAILDGKGVNGAAREAEVHRGTVYRWMRSDPALPQNPRDVPPAHPIRQP